MSDINQTNEVDTESTDEIIDHESELQTRVASLESSQDLMKLLSDPDVMKVIEAKQGGSKVTVSLEDLVKSPNVVDQVAELTKDMDSDDPQRDLLGQLAHLLDERLGPLADRIDAVENHARNGVKKDINAEVATARTKFSDFDAYKDMMVQLSEELPGLAVQELYVLAKTRKGDLDISNPATFVEKPTQQSSTRRNTPSKPTNPRRGRRGRHEMLSEALERVDFSEL